MSISLGLWLESAKNLGYVIEDEVGFYNVNIVGWRNKKGEVNKFDDFIACYWKTEAAWIGAEWPASTKPGLHYLLKPMNEKGTAILVPGFYEDVYEIGIHKGETALKQVRPMKVYRDNSKDDKIDKDKTEDGLFGIDIHAAGIFSKFVDYWSAGCQVFQKKKDFKQFMRLCRISMKPRFNYTLLEF